jgi:hypothetical protein
MRALLLEVGGGARREVLLEHAGRAGGHDVRLAGLQVGDVGVVDRVESGLQLAAGALSDELGALTVAAGGGAMAVVVWVMRISVPV